MKNIPAIIVMQDAKGMFTAEPEGACGSPIVGRGASVLEAVGEFAIQTQLVHIKCRPPAVLREYKISNPYVDLEFDSPDRR